MKKARNSFGEPYLCKKQWDDAIFVQCGGNGIVLSQKDFEKSLTDPKEAVDTIKAVAGEPTNKKHYRTAFFEAFPKNPSCFLRGEGKTIEEAEESCWNKYQSVMNCKGHDFERRKRTDGYCYCKNCPLSGMFMDPSTTCVVCGTPTARLLENKTYKCINHYFESPLSDVIDYKNPHSSNEEYEIYFIEEKILYEELIKNNLKIDEKNWEKVNDHFIQIRGIFTIKYKPFFGDPLLSDQEIHELFKKEIPRYVQEYLSNHNALK